MAAGSRRADAEVLSASVLGVLPEAVLARVAGEVTGVELATGRPLFDYQLSIVAAGRLRAYITDPGGRQLTVGYLSVPSAVGLAHVAGRRYPTAFQCLAPTRLLGVGDGRFAELVAAHPELGWAAATEITARLDDVEAELARVAFGSLRQRLAYHLLALSAESDAPVHQAQLAAAVGSVREVVARSLAQLRVDGLVDVGPGGAVVVDRAGLSRIVEL